MKTRINFLLKKYLTDEHMSKSVSNGVMQNVCPYCSYAAICTAESKDGTEKVCHAKSTESTRTWIRITDTRNKIEIGRSYGNTKVLSQSHKDDNGYIYWNCLRNDVEVVVRGDNLLRINKDKAERKYRRGSSRNPDGTLHIYPNEHHSKVGCAIEKVASNTIIDEDGDHVVHRYETRTHCECGAAMRYDEYGDSVCESCIGLNRRQPKPCLDPEIIWHSKIDWMGPLETRDIASDTSTPIRDRTIETDKATEETAQFVADFRKWCDEL